MKGDDPIEDYDCFQIPPGLACRTLQLLRPSRVTHKMIIVNGIMKTISTVSLHKYAQSCF
jgi:hypothetical protein